MKLKLTIKDFNEEEFNLSNKDKKSLTYSLYKDMIDKFNKTDFQVNSSNEKDLEEKTQNIDIYFVNSSNKMSSLFDNQDNALGCFLIYDNNDILDSKGFLDSFSIVLVANDNKMHRTVEKMISNNNESYNENNFKKHLSSFICTLPHELSHAIEFIENSNGLTPYQINQQFINKENSNDVFNIATGYNTKKYHEDFKNIKSHEEDKIIDIVEDRIEEKSLMLLEQMTPNFKRIFKNHKIFDNNLTIN